MPWTMVAPEISQENELFENPPLAAQGSIFFRILSSRQASVHSSSTLMAACSTSLTLAHSNRFRRSYWRARTRRLCWRQPRRMPSSTRCFIQHKAPRNAHASQSTHNDAQPSQGSGRGTDGRQQVAMNAACDSLISRGSPLNTAGSIDDCQVQAQPNPHPHLHGV